MVKKFWQKREDGVLHADPEGFSNGYYIYPPNYQDGELGHSDRYELWLIGQDGRFSHEENYQFETSASAQKHAISIFKNIITQYSPLLEDSSI